MLREGRRILRSFVTEKEALDRFHYLLQKTPWEDIELYRMTNIDLCECVKSHMALRMNNSRNVLKDLDEIIKYYYH